MKVTAEDATTTNPYTVVVTRAAANIAPTAANNTVTTGVGEAYTFAAGDFGFTDADSGDALASVKIVTVPTPGELALDGTAVLADAVVTKAQIDDGDLIFTPVAGATGDPYATFTFKVNDGTVDSASAYTMTIDVTSSGPAITIAADRPTATGKIDWIYYTLNREGDPAAELTVTVTFEGPASNDWSLDPTGSAKREVTFTANSAAAEQSIRLTNSGFGNIGFSSSAITSGALTARLGAKTGFDTSDTDEVQVAVSSGPAWVIKLADDAYRFDEDGGDQNIEVVATAASADMPAPSLDASNNSVLSFVLTTDGVTARAPGDFTDLSTARYLPSSTCSADPNVQVCRLNVPFTPVDDAEAEPDETLNLGLQTSPGGSTRDSLPGPGPGPHGERFVQEIPRHHRRRRVRSDGGHGDLDAATGDGHLRGVGAHRDLGLVQPAGDGDRRADLRLRPRRHDNDGRLPGGLGHRDAGVFLPGHAGQLRHQRHLLGCERARAVARITEMGGTEEPTTTVVAVSAASSHKVNGTLTASGAATVSTVTVTSTPLLMATGSTSADTYGVGETIEFTVTFSAAVTVTGDPEFAFSLSNPGQTGIADKLAALQPGREHGDDAGVPLHGAGHRRGHQRHLGGRPVADVEARPRRPHPHGVRQQPPRQSHP